MRQKIVGNVSLAWVLVFSFAYITLSLLLTDYLWRVIDTSIETLLTYIFLGNLIFISLMVTVWLKRARKFS